MRGIERKPIYNVAYDTSEGIKFYCVCWMNRQQASSILQDFKRRYVNPDGTPKRYPNKKGYYDISNPRLVRDMTGQLSKL
jgi:hypothetical protein